MEFSEPHLYPNEFASLSQSFEWDVIIGSVHMIRDRSVGNLTFEDAGDLEKHYINYFSIMLEMVRSGGFDVLGHLDFAKRQFFLYNH
ncbi:MAG: hypothetical protein JXR86_18965 [Spirochaetales bacterium]|nr:hypothetical protein [Spirochaetales bacterium]